MARILYTVLVFCTLSAFVRGRAVVSPRKQAEIMVSKTAALNPGAESFVFISKLVLLPFNFSE